MKSLNNLFSTIFLLIVLVSCSDTPKKEIAQISSKNIETEASIESLKQSEKPNSQAFKDYWYSGKAEISSYKLEQVRYGEMRQGEAVLIYVTEDFLPNKQVKADASLATNIPVLKLNATKNFTTGIYPYSIMQSTFQPISKLYPLKISASVQEWCGHVYTQLNNRDNFEITSHSYFQSEADENYSLNKTWTENTLWTQLRLDPERLPTGKIEIIPSLEYLRLNHKTTKAYKAEASFTNGKYTIHYPELQRSLIIDFNTNFPYDILGWKEYNTLKNRLITKSTKLKTLILPYWSKNKNKDAVLRESLDLK